MISGLSAATLLQEHGVNVVVLEANDRVGGRTLTVTPSKAEDPQFGWVDLGASYVGPTQDHILRLCKKLGCQTYLCRDNHDVIHYSKVSLKVHKAISYLERSRQVYKKIKPTLLRFLKCLLM